MPQDSFTRFLADNYETLWPELFEPELLDATAGLLERLAAGGRALEFGIGTGRVAQPLHRRGVPVRGIELSEAMAARVDPGIDVVIGDFATTAVDGEYSLVYLLRNTITNLTTQDEQIAAFRNAAARLAPGGAFLIENYVPALRRLPPGENRRVFVATAEHVGFEEYDFDTQIAVSRHHWALDGELHTYATPHRYVWPSELDLMAQLAGLRLDRRWGDWDESPFTGDSPGHISVWRAGT